MKNNQDSTRSVPWTSFTLASKTTTQEGRIQPPPPEVGILAYDSPPVGRHAPNFALKQLMNQLAS